MAHIKRTHPTYLLVGYRPTPAASELYWRCPDEATFNRFQQYEVGCRRSGLPMGSPASLFGEVALPISRKVESETGCCRQAIRSANAKAPDS